MTPVLRIASDELGRYLVFLGSEQIGEIAPCNPASRVRYHWSLRLPSLRRLCMQEAMTLEAARDAMVRELEAWSVRVGYFYPGQSVEVGSIIEKEAKRA